MTLIEWWVMGTVVSGASEGWGVQTLLWGGGASRICEDLSKGSKQAILSLTVVSDGDYCRLIVN